MGMPLWTLCVRSWDAERPGLHSHAGAWERSVPCFTLQISFSLGHGLTLRRQFTHQHNRRQPLPGD
ncbi:hypothetical protein CUN61_24140 [Pseudomonas arsenicoxydans]|uniref:Uncharacterized protein n=1 Tax=Pseudomonas arsenicoxydans TaxID=702115 RepID=A0A4P6G5M4_9PSED|nr:hypothetical protein CUN61_24140 [Pseudomonas arsenicoxydans]